MSGLSTFSVTVNFFTVLAVWAVLGSITMGIAAQKGRSRLWFFLYGVLLFPIAIVHCVAMRSRRADPVHEALTRQAEILQSILLAIRQQQEAASVAAKAPVPFPMPSGPIDVAPTKIAQLSPETFLDQAADLGLRTGSKGADPYRVLSDGEVEVLRPDLSIEVYASLRDLDEGRVLRIVEPIRSRRRRFDR